LSYTEIEGRVHMTVKWLGIGVGVTVLMAAVSLLAATVTGQTASPYPSGVSGYDISFAQCPSQFPAGGAFGIIGVTDGLPWSVNPCLAAEYGWASTLGSAPSYYMNTANPGPVSSHWQLPGPRPCADYSSYTETGCAYNYGWNAALQAFGAAGNATSAAAAASHTWWLDVEMANSWNGSVAANQAAIQGYLDYLNAQGVPLTGIYSTPSQWTAITGGAILATIPNWATGASSASDAPSYCRSTVTGGVVLLSQYGSGGFDADYACAPAEGSATSTATSSPTSSRTTNTPTPTNTQTPTSTPTSSPSPVGLVRDHKTDANGDGYSAADEVTAANCGVVNCASIITFGAVETKTCKDAGRHCGVPNPPADESGPARTAPPPAMGYGCSVTLDTVGPLTTKNLAKSDIDLDGVVSILDLTKVASWFGNTINASPSDPRWEGDMDGDGVISVLDLTAMASNFVRSVANDCKVE
jgi:hypothetical protein